MPVLVAVSLSLAVLTLCTPDRLLPWRGRWLRNQLNRLGRRTVYAPVTAVPLWAFQWAERLPVGPIVSLLDSLYSPRYKAWFRQRVLFARLEERLTWRQFLSLKAAVPLLGLLYIGLITLGNGLDISVIIVSPIPLLAFFVPDQWLNGRMRRRQNQVERELPAVLTTLAIAAEAGLGLAAAIDEVARTATRALPSEFRWAAEQVALGMPQGRALEEMAARCGVPDLTMFASSLVQSFEKGSGHVSETLRAQSQDAWAKRRRRAEELAQTASVRLFLPLVLLVFPAIMIFLLGPALITVSDFFSQQP